MRTPSTTSQSPSSSARKKSTISDSGSEDDIEPATTEDLEELMMQGLVPGPASATDTEADMIVMGSHGRGAVRQLLIGSVSEGVLRAAECPVLIVPCR